jgi:hypothetical protein
VTTIILNYAHKILSLTLIRFVICEHTNNNKFYYKVEITISSISIDGCTTNGISSILARPSSKGEFQAAPHGDQNIL